MFVQSKETEHEQIRWTEVNIGENRLEKLDMPLKTILLNAGQKLNFNLFSLVEHSQQRANVINRKKLKKRIFQRIIFKTTTKFWRLLLILNNF